MSKGHVVQNLEDIFAIHKTRQHLERPTCNTNKDQINIWSFDYISIFMHAAEYCIISKLDQIVKYLVQKWDYWEN